MNKLITVGIPAFNRAAGLRATLQCICAQSYKNLEILVSDNCSENADIEQVVTQFSASDHRVKYFRQSENVGAYRNCEFLAQKAAGEYFLIASDDDGWENNYIEVLSQQLDEDSNAALAASSIIIFRTGLIGSDDYSDHFSGNNFLQYREQDVEKRVCTHLLEPDGNSAHLVYGLWRSTVAKEAFSVVLKIYADLIATDVQLVLFLLCQGYISTTKNTHKIYLVHPSSTGYGGKWSYKAMHARYSASKEIIVQTGSNRCSEAAVKILEKKLKYLLLNHLMSNFKNSVVMLLKFFKLHHQYLVLKKNFRA